MALDVHTTNKTNVMIIYFAGDGKKMEEDKHAISSKSKNWGVLLSYKSVKTKSNEGNKRFKRLMRKIK